MKKSYGTIIAGLIVVAVLAAIFMRGDQLEHLVQTIEKGTPFFLILALIFQIGKYVSQAASFTWCFKAAGEKLPFKENLKLVFETYFVDTAIPSFNISGTTVVVETASRYKIEPGRSTGAALLRQISISASFIIIMVIGFAILLFMGKLQPGWIILGAIAVVGVGSMVAGMALAAIRPQWVLKIAAPFVRIFDRLLIRFHKKTIDSKVHDLVETYSQSAKLMVHNKKDIAAELGFNVLANVFEILCFAFVGMAFGMNSFEADICVYVVATLAAIVSPIPQGVGVVEAASLVAFTMFGIQQATGMAVIMVYRAIIFWIPFLIGALLMQRSQLKGPMKRNGTPTQKAGATAK